MGFQRLARAEDIPPGRTQFVCVGEAPVVLANWAGRIYALHGVCPHRNNPLEGARVWNFLLDCPWHHFQYDVRSGENHYPRNVYPADMPHLQAQLHPLRTFPVQIRDGEVWVDLG